MKFFSIALLFYLTCVATSYSQTTTKSSGRVDVEIKKEKQEVHIKVEIKPVITDEDSLWIKSIERTLNKSFRDKNDIKPGNYIVSVAFVVNKAGDVSDIHCVNKPFGFGIEEEVLKAVKGRPRWSSCSKGIPVRPYRTSSSTPPCK